MRRIPASGHARQSQWVINLTIGLGLWERYPRASITSNDETDPASHGGWGNNTHKPGELARQHAPGIGEHNQAEHAQDNQWIMLDLHAVSSSFALSSSPLPLVIRPTRSASWWTSSSSR